MIGTRSCSRNGGKSRSRMTLAVDAKLRRLLDAAKFKSGNRTASKAIQWALKEATKEQAPVPSATLGLKIIQWAEKLAFMSPKETAEMRKLVAEMYQLLRKP
jgi:hypothetical protein